MINHPLPPGTTVIADVRCKTCGIDAFDEELREVEIINHSTTSDGVIRYRVTTLPIRTLLLADDIKEVVE
jgi:hypothetical protein